MSQPKKGESLSVGAKSYCNAWIKTKLYNDRVNLFSSQYTAKGNIVEDNSIDFIADRLGYGFLLKNEDHFEDNFKTGTPDIIPPGDNLVIDVKSSWSWETFPFMEEKLPDNSYYWQIQGYMSLTGRSHGKVIYVLMDTPEYLIESYARRYCYTNGYGELDMDVYRTFERNLTYDDVPDRFKLKCFDVDRNNEDIERIDHVVNECRKYIEERIKELNF